jgi:hypothetical protein
MRRTHWMFLTAGAVAVAAAVAVALASWASTPATGFVSGRLQTVGGPAPGTPKPISGKVTVTGLNGKSYSAKVRADGQFLILVPVGSYFVTGSSPLYAFGQPVCLGMGFKVNENATTSNVEVNCPGGVQGLTTPPSFTGLEQN